jgi:ABC-type Fe3+/spermidine/putrescine transport system ATPase subunit
MTMADRIVVMDQGRIAQAGTPEEVFDRPNSPFIASFMGADNTIDLDVSHHGEVAEIAVPGSDRGIPCGNSIPAGRMTAHFRDDVARLVEPGIIGNGEIVLPGTIVARAYPGGHYRYGVEVAGRHYSVKDAVYREVGGPIGLSLPVDALHLFPAEASTNSGRSEP